MTIDFIGKLVNIMGLLLPLSFSFSVGKMYARPDFLNWTLSYVFYALSVVLLALPTTSSTSAYLSLGLIATYSLASWCLIRTAATFRPLERLKRATGAVLVTMVLVSGTLTLLGQPFELVAAGPVLAGVVAHWVLAWAIVSQRRDTRTHPWLAILVGLTGTWMLAFPLIHGEMLAWGYMISGTLHLMVGVQMVIYVLKDIAHVLQLQNEELKELDRMKGNFMSAVSHELRTPLTSIMGFAELLEDEIGGPLSDTQREFVQRVQDSSSDLLDIVDNVLDFMRLEAGSFQLTPQHADLGEVVKCVLPGFTHDLRSKGLTLTTHFPAEPLIARVDTRRLHQVIKNLLSNAIKFTPNTGSLTLTLAQQGDMVRFAMSDTGIGIEAEHLPRLFDKFYQADPSLTRTYSGVGLGLTVVKASVEAHEGCIAVDSQPGRGSTFTVTLPVAGPTVDEEA